MSVKFSFNAKKCVFPTTLNSWPHCMPWMPWLYLCVALTWWACQWMCSYSVKIVNSFVCVYCAYLSVNPNWAGVRRTVKYQVCSVFDLALTRSKFTFPVYPGCTVGANETERSINHKCILHRCAITPWFFLWICRICSYVSPDVPY